LFHYARKLGATYNVPWIADYRDPWTPNLKNENWFIKEFNAFLENRISSKAKLITTVSSFFENQIQKHVPNGKFSIIPNGFDEESMKQIESIEQDSGMLRIGFVGTIYEWHPLIVLLETLNCWVLKFPDRKIELHFHGTNKNEYISELLKNQYPKLIEAVVTHPKLPNQQLLEKLARYNVLLLFNYYAYMGTKIYDYLGLKRKILFCFTDDPESIKLKNRFYPLEANGASESLQKELIIKSNAGILISNTDDLIQVLNALYQEHKETGAIKCHSFGVEKFSRRIQAERLANLIKTLTKPIPNDKLGIDTD
jgi:glycosyltransferase involved in cell wall biosynthesis